MMHGLAPLCHEAGNGGNNGRRCPKHAHTVFLPDFYPTQLILTGKNRSVPFSHDTTCCDKISLTFKTIFFIFSSCKSKFLSVRTSRSEFFPQLASWHIWVIRLIDEKCYVYYRTSEDNETVKYHFVSMLLQVFLY